MKKTVLVVGASKGLGLAIVNFLRKEYGEEFQIIGVSRTRGDLPKEVIHLPCDICDEEQQKKTIDLIKSAYQQIDYFIMSVGGIRDDVDKEYKLNYIAPKNFINELLGIVDHYLVISSFSAKDPNNYRFKQGGYSWAKGCLSSWVFYLEKAGIVSVTLVEPAFFYTELMKKVKDPFFPARVEVVAKRSVKAMLDKKKHSYLSYFTVILGVSSSILPRFMMRPTDFLLVQIYRLSVKIVNWKLKNFKF